MGIDKGVFMTKDNGGPAFPIVDLDVTKEGMTLRDYYAAKALQGICASGPSDNWTNMQLAIEAYSLADAMLEARK